VDCFVGRLGEKLSSNPPANAGQRCVLDLGLALE